ncbi:MAG: type I DNA topoisomerase [Candidatus Spechtbacterales bacterium]
MDLVIVESPTKARTISRFLGNEFEVTSSFGHIRDLPKGKLGVDVEHDFAPHYVIPTRSRKNVTALKKALAKADSVILATDEDREGEAIAWHLTQVLDLKGKEAKRIVFHEITKEAIERALKEPRPLDSNLVDAQQARRILDRLVGYSLSPFLWKKVARGLSAGRVQSVAVRIIVEREREREAFKEQEYYSIEALLHLKGAPEGQASEFSARLHAKEGKTLDKLAIGSKEAADAIVQALEAAEFTVADVEEKETKRNPFPPFTTSTLQQTAGARFGFQARRTMSVAQNLYERGFITYHRTDSLNLAESAVTAARSYLQDEFGTDYLPEKPKRYRTSSKGAQEAHEAIRPAFAEGQNLASRHPDNVKLEGPQKKLYTLIWQRFMASQMTPARFAATTVDIATTTPYALRATGSILRFAGFTKVYPVSMSENELPPLSKNDALEQKGITAEQHFTQPPARYSEATLIKELERLGIGRPSTYASIISTIQDRNYVLKDDNKRLLPSDMGKLVNDLLVEHFSRIVDYAFTAKMEGNLDDVAEGERDWHEVMREFYEPFEKNLEEKSEELSRAEITGMRELGVHPETKEPISVRVGRYGPFVQMGEAEDDKKPKFAPLPKGKGMDEVTLEDALQYLSLPHDVGTDADGNTITVNVGPYGPYVKVLKTYYSIKEDNPYTLTKERALEIIAAKKEEEEKSVIKEFEGTNIIVKVGRYGPYITDGEVNARIPKGTEPQEVTKEMAQELIAKAAARPKRGKTRRAPAKK